VRRALFTLSVSAFYLGLAGFKGDRRSPDRPPMVPIAPASISARLASNNSSYRSKFLALKLFPQSLSDPSRLVQVRDGKYDACLLCAFRHGRVAGGDVDLFGRQFSGKAPERSGHVGQFNIQHIRLGV